MGSINQDLTVEDREFTARAITNFNETNYAACIEILSELEISRPNDIKVGVSFI